MWRAVLSVCFFLIFLIRFRMQQVNIVGSSPMSAPSRLIQTLQAAPDAHPSNLKLVSATQTSLHFSWKVPKHTQVHANQTHAWLCKIINLYSAPDTHLNSANLTGISLVSLRTFFVYLLLFLHQCSSAQSVSVRSPATQLHRLSVWQLIISASPGYHCSE